MKVAFFDINKSACDAFVEITIGDQVRKTQVNIIILRLDKVRIIRFFNNNLILLLKICL